MGQSPCLLCGISILFIFFVLISCSSSIGSSWSDISSSSKRLLLTRSLSRSFAFFLFPRTKTSLTALTSCRLKVQGFLDGETAGSYAVNWNTFTQKESKCWLSFVITEVTGNWHFPATHLHPLQSCCKLKALVILLSLQTDLRRSECVSGLRLAATLAASSTPNFEYSSSKT